MSSPVADDAASAVVAAVAVLETFDASVAEAESAVSVAEAVADYIVNYMSMGDPRRRSGAYFLVALATVEPQLFWVSRRSPPVDPEFSTNQP